MKVSCQSCSAKYTIADEKVVGRIVKIRCKKCGATIVVNGNDMAAADGAPASADSGDVWTVNVDDTDQRTMSVAEIVTAYRGGVITDETYCWKEGMDDWAPLRDVDALAQAVGSGASAPPPAVAPAASDVGTGGGGLFGSSESSLFGSADPAPAAARRSGGRANSGDLFGTAAQAGGEDDVLTSAPGLTPPPTGDTKLTGQRNENSVLFSLNALTAQEPTKNETTAQGDGSGLIDIRALSSSLNTNDNQSSKVDDIMNLSGGGAFNAALTAPVLAPPIVGAGATPSFAPEPQQQQSNNKPLIIGFGVLLAFIAVAATVVYIALKPDETTARNDLPPTTPTGVAAPAEVPTTPPAVTTAAPAETAPVASAVAPGVGAAPTAPEKPAGGGGGTAKSTGGGGGGGSSTKSNNDSSSAPATAPAAAPTKPKSLADAMAASAGGGSSASAGGGGGGSTSPFDRGAATAALGSVNVSSCKKGDSGNGHVKVTFAPNGSVSSAVVDDGPFVGTPVGGCVAGKYRGARVPAFSGSAVTVGKSFFIN